ncbi:Subunit of the glycosylphosphatidylinositol transamidase complex-like protein [Oleoguttula sp. CCFEE 5521]
MHLATLLSLPASLALLSLSLASVSPHSYTEHLHLLPLPQSHLHAHFNFTATTPLSAYESSHFRYFPRSLAQILQHTRTKELHLRFTTGRWDDEAWGARPLEGTREGGTGVELWAWVDRGGSKTVAEERWSELVNSLSGLFCASLNFIDSTKTIRPVRTFEPEGDHGEQKGNLQLLHGMLPHEVVCTENLTPFLKLLPCKGKAGISTLLDGHKLFDAKWQSMAIDVRPVCEGKIGEECVLEIQQSVSMALSISRSMRDRHDPIPRPARIEDVECDESKPWNGHDTCFPKALTGEPAWTLSKVLGHAAKGACDLERDDQAFDVTLEVPSDRPVNATGASELTLPSTTRRHYRLSSSSSFDLSLPTQSSPISFIALSIPPLYATRQIAGHGQERGSMHTTLRNPHAHPLTLVYMETLPWYLRPYMHTLRLSNGKQEKMYYTPALDRERGTHLELVLTIPAQSTATLTYDFEKAVLRYTEYPPDANRGFDVAPAVIRVLASNASQDYAGSYVRTTSLLLSLPTPDFSMPYNVIILTSTVIALGFGSLFNLLTRSFVLAEEVPPSPLAGIVRRLQGLAQGMLGKKGGAAEAEKNSGTKEGKVTEISEPVEEETEGKANGIANGHADLRERKARETP